MIGINFRKFSHPWHFRCGFKLAVMEKRSKIKSTHVNTDGKLKCTIQSGLAMLFNKEERKCTLGAVGNNITGSPSSPQNIEVYMSEETIMNYKYLNMAGKKTKCKER